MEFLEVNEFVVAGMGAVFGRLELLLPQLPESVEPR